MSLNWPELQNSVNIANEKNTNHLNNTSHIRDVVNLEPSVISLMLHGV